MNNNIVIKVENLTKIYKIFDNPVDRLKESLNPFHKRYSKDFYALKDISFEIRKGETVGIIGKNGAGKSTLLKIITGVLTPSKGIVEIKGSVASLLELGAGFNPELTGIENVYLNGTIMGYSKTEMDKRLKDIVNFADIGEFIYQPVKMYSSGMFARLAFAVNAFVEPDILIVDEALSVGDSIFQIKCMKKMRELMEGGTSVLFVSHDINAVRRFCSRAFWFDHGSLIDKGETNYVADNYIESLKIEAENEKNSIPKPRKNIELKKDLAEIMSFKILDNDEKEIKRDLPFDQPLKVEVIYDVKKTNIDKPVLGIALRSVSEDYICGLNTLLDRYKIPWHKGINRVILNYTTGLRILSGRYYFDVALFEETATIPMHYITKVKMISVKHEYKGEGVFIIPHVWNS